MMVTVLPLAALKDTQQLATVSIPDHIRRYIQVYTYSTMQEEEGAKATVGKQVATRLEGGREAEEEKTSDL